jgi:hypothetical protein
MFGPKERSHPDPGFQERVQPMSEIWQHGRWMGDQAYSLAFDLAQARL